MTEEEWKCRYKQRLLEKGVPEIVVSQIVNAEPYDQLVICYENDPEGAADEEFYFLGLGAQL